MIIDSEDCIACESCVPYCPVGAIAVDDSYAKIDQDLCVECGVCLRAEVCPTDAISQPELQWPRTLRALFSNPITVFEETGVAGRGTDEVKTNDVTGRYRRGEVGFGIEMGRPGTGTSFRQVQQLTAALARLGVRFEEKNPLTTLLSDPAAGTMREDILDERVLTAIVEFKVPIGRIHEVLDALREAEKGLETVFSLDFISRPEADGSLPALEVLKRLGYHPSEHVKICTGLGHPRID
ncbi:MAG: 4Fe-4S dicluster domain-containing protein [Desulfobacteraceae bacterium]|nr:MAG: 4Fe-4S dicluster domain-containing protein [Desulfobacteraceae bacterium]